MAPGPQEITAQPQADGTVLVEGSQASFLMPSGNVACVIRPDTVVCQIDGKQHAARQEHINPETFKGCAPKTADAGPDPASARQATSATRRWPSCPAAPP